MASKDVVINMSVQDANVVQAWVNARKGPQQMAEELEKVNKASQRASRGAATTARTTGQAFGDAAMSVGKLGMAMVGLGSAAAAVTTLTSIATRELERIKAMRGQFADQQIDTGKAFMQMANALDMKGIKVDPQKIKSQIEKSNYGVNLSELFRVSEKALSSAGAMPQEKVIESVTESARLFPYMNEEDRTALVVASNNIQKTFGVTPAEAMSQVVQSAAVAPGAELADFATYYGGGASKLAAVGANKDSYQDLMALLAGIGHRSQDMTGRTTATNTQNALMQLKQEGMKAGMFGEDASIMQMLDAIHGDDAKAKGLRAKLLGVFAGAPEELLKAQQSGNVDLASEAKTKIALMELIKGGDNQTMREIASARGKLGTFAEAEVTTNATREKLRGMDSQAAMEAAGARTSMSQKLRQLPGPAQAEETRRQYAEMMSDTGESWMRSTGGEWLRQIAASEDPVKAAEERIADIEMRQKELSAERQYTTVGRFFRDISGGGFIPNAAAIPTAAGSVFGAGLQRPQSEQDRQMIRILEETKALIKEALDAQKETAANTAKTAAPPSPKPVKNPASALSG